MSRLPRHEKILELVRTNGFMSIDELSRLLDVTPQTIRRDINGLCEENLLRRYHGGAGIGSSVENEEYSARKVKYQVEKEHIAAEVVQRIPNHASLFLNIGTTVEAVAKALLVNHRGLKIITNNLNVAAILSPRQDFEVIIAGGVVRPRDGGIIGEATIDFIRQFKVDFAVIGISGIEDDGTLLDFDYREVKAAQAIIEQSRQVYLAVDSSKFGRNAMVRLGHVSQLDAVFTDLMPPPAVIEQLKQAEVALHVVN